MATLRSRHCYPHFTHGENSPQSWSYIFSGRREIKICDGLTPKIMLLPPTRTNEINSGRQVSPLMIEFSNSENEYHLARMVGSTLIRGIQAGDSVSSHMRLLQHSLVRSHSYTHTPPTTLIHHAPRRWSESLRGCNLKVHSQVVPVCHGGGCCCWKSSGKEVGLDVPNTLLNPESPQLLNIYGASTGHTALWLGASRTFPRAEVRVSTRSSMTSTSSCSNTTKVWLKRAAEGSRNALGRSKPRPQEAGLKVCCVYSHLVRSRKKSGEERLGWQVGKPHHHVPPTSCSS